MQHFRKAHFEVFWNLLPDHQDPLRLSPNQLSSCNWSFVSVFGHPIMLQRCFSNGLLIEKEKKKNRKVEKSLLKKECWHAIQTYLCLDFFWLMAYKCIQNQETPPMQSNDVPPPHYPKPVLECLAHPTFHLSKRWPLPETWCLWVEPSSWCTVAAFVHQLCKPVTLKLV